MTISILPDVVNFQVIRGVQDLNGNGEADNYFDLTFNSNSTFLPSAYASWCIDLDTEIQTGINYTGNLYSSYETIPDGLVERPDNLDLITWIMNQDYINRYTADQIQQAIWHLVESDFVTTDPGSLAIVQEAITNGENFIPDNDDDIALIIAPIPEGGEEGDAQVIIIDIPLPEIEDFIGIDIEKLTNGEDADTVADAVRLSPGDDLTWLYQVTNTGRIPFPIADLTVIDDLEGTPTFVADSDVGSDGILSPGEQVLYEITAPNGAENLVRSLDFETRPDGTALEAGEDLTNAYADWGITISTMVTPEQRTGEITDPLLPMVFDSSNPTGNDPDLGSPNQDFGGPGQGIGGSAGSVYENDQAFDNIAIISQDNDPSNPNDNRAGGTIRFDFETPTFLESTEIIDASEPSTIVTLDAAGEVINEYAISVPDPNQTEAENEALFGKNNVQIVDLNNDFASAIEFRFDDSAGVANLVFTPYYQNEATVTVDGVIPGLNLIAPITDSDTSTYINANPSFTLETSTHGEDADTLEDAAVVAPGDANGVLSPGEQWTYWGDGVAEDLSFEMDFDTDAAGHTLAAGTIIDTEYQDIGVTVSTPGHDHGAMIFDTAHATGSDWDLLDPNLKNGDDLLGKVLILSEDGISDNPDDNANGGTVRFEFDELLGISHVNLFDIDAHESVEIRTFDASGNLLTTSVFEGAGNNMRQTAEINSGLIAAMDVELTGSGAITGLAGDRVYTHIGSATVVGFADLMASDPNTYVNHGNVNHGNSNHGNSSVLG